MTLSLSLDNGATDNDGDGAFLFSNVDASHKSLFSPLPGASYERKIIVWPAHRGAVGYSSVKVTKDGAVAVHFDSGLHADGCCVLLSHRRRILLDAMQPKYH